MRPGSSSTSAWAIGAIVGGVAGLVAHEHDVGRFPTWTIAAWGFAGLLAPYIWIERNNLGVRNLVIFLASLAAALPWMPLIWAAVLAAVAIPGAWVAEIIMNVRKSKK